MERLFTSPFLKYGILCKFVKNVKFDLSSFRGYATSGSFKLPMYYIPSTILGTYKTLHL